ncbi:MAG: hypothetical protein KatS3mg101_1100 [Patescibacteria group bacterium]|nr:MAG: hypothetical protein KatS3mg101_1100 [Patescibacteria group bacterium]
MEATTIKNLADISYAGAIAIIGIYFIKFILAPIINYLINKKNGYSNDIEKRIKKIENNDLHDLEDLRNRIYKIEDEVTKIRERLTRIETKLNL